MRGTDEPTDAAPADQGQQARRDAARLRVLTDFAKVVSAARSYDDVLRLAAIESRRALDGASASISVLERESGLLRTLVNEGDLGPGERQRPDDEAYLLAEDTLVERMFHDGGGYVVDLDHRRSGDHLVADLLRSTGKHSGIGVPILLEGRHWGELWVTRTADQPRFTEADLDFAVAVASQTAAGIAQAEHIARVERLAYTDPLTGLGNRRTFDDRLDEAVAAHREHGEEVALILADVNGLKAINDEYGHQRGDSALSAFAAVIARIGAAHERCTVARLGGDEFCLVLRGVPADEVVQTAEQVCERALTVLPDGVACGVATSTDAPPPLTEPAQLLRLADAAQYRAKRSRLTTPVIAGRHLSGAAMAAARLSAERRTFRGTGADTVRLGEIGVAALDTLGPRSVRERLTAVASTIGPAVDAASWWVCEVAPGTDRIVTRDAALYRRPDGYQAMFQRYYDDPEGYPIADFPATDAASRGHGPVMADVRTGEGDPAELSILALEGCEALVMCGGVDAWGSRWVIEMHVDDLSSPMTSFVPALRVLVALAIVEAGEPTGSSSS